MTLFEEDFPQNDADREREREGRRERERDKEKQRKRAIELDAKWYGNCRKWSTTGWFSLIDFARWVNMRNRFCLAYAKLNGLPCMVPGYRFWGALSLYSVSCTSLTKNSCNTKAVFKRFDRDSHVSSISHTRQPWKALEAHHICRSFWAASLAVPSSLKSGHIIGTLQITKETQQNN